MAQQSARRGRKNQMYSSCLQHAFMIWFRSANSHTGPQLHRCIRGRTDGSIRLRANLLQKTACTWRGVLSSSYALNEKTHGEEKKALKRGLALPGQGTMISIPCSASAKTANQQASRRERAVLVANGTVW